MNEHRYLQRNFEPQHAPSFLKIYILKEINLKKLRRHIQEIGDIITIREQLAATRFYHAFSKGDCYFAFRERYRT